VVNARGGNTKMVGATYDAYDTLIDDVLTDVENGLATSTRNANVLTWVDSIIIGLALLAAIILALLVSRLLVGPIRRVRAGALEVAHERLPEAVAKIRAGEDPGEIEPINVTTHEETGQLARAVDDLHRQAVKLASGEADLRAQVGDMFVTLSRRNTSLINQQLGLIETLESDEEDPQRLESLFRLDHLASRMRRNAESLVILSGAPTRATEQDDLSLTDVLQAAIAGVQDYRRVQLDAAPAQRVSGEASADVVHLLSELVDNALSYSPPSSKVMVTSSFTRGGVIVQVTDGGLGIAEDAL
jgi:signal transduction histidine kinase